MQCLDAPRQDIVESAGQGDQDNQDRTDCNGNGRYARCDLCEQNEQAEAIKALQQTVQWLPQHVGSWNTLTWCYLLAERVEEAEQAASRAIDLQPAFSESQAMMGLVAIAKKQPKAAEPYIRKALKLNPESLAAMYGQLMLAQHNQDEIAVQKFSENILNTELTEGLTIRKVIQQQMKKKLH